MGTPGETKEGCDYRPGVYDRFSRLRLLLVNTGTEFKGAPPTREVFDKLNECIWGFRDNLQLLRDNQYRPTPPVILQHLAFTCFAPGGRADRARMAVELMETTGDWFRNPDIEYAYTEERVAGLAELITPYVRFPNQKAVRFLQAAPRLPYLRNLICDGQLDKARMQGAYEFMLENMPGFGMKSAAHFLRNIGMFSDDYAFPIIDVHIHKALASFGFRHADYEESQAAFCHLANLSELPVILLDAALWCSYANNWNISHSDFDNFAVQADVVAAERKGEALPGPYESEV